MNQRKRERVSLDISELKLTDIGIPVFSLCWLTREFFGFALKDAPRQETPSEDAEPILSPGVRRTRLAWRDLTLALLIATLFYTLAIWRLATPNKQIFDEVHHARTAMEYVDGLNPHEWSHPPFSKEMMALSIIIWHGEFDPRDGPWKPDMTFPDRDAVAWRYASVVYGTATVAAMYFLGLALFGNRAIATAAAALLSLDGVFFVQSRVAMTNIFTVFFIVVAAIGVAHFLRDPRARWLTLAGASLGFAIASRWSSLYAWGVTILLLGLYQLQVLQRYYEAEADAEENGDEPPARPYLMGWRFLGVGFLCLFLIPFVVYFATYIPNMIQGSGSLAQKLFTANGPHNVGWVKTFLLQLDMYEYHSTLVASHPYDSPWWTWPLELRPVWYAFDKAGPHLIAGVWCIGNVFIWWASVPIFLTLGFLGWRYETRRGGRGIGPLTLIPAYGLGQWLAWGIKERSLNFMHYYFECIPFACLGLAYLGYRIWVSETDTPGQQIVRRTLVAIYAAAVVLWFIFYYPLLSAYPVTEWYYGQHLWLGTRWV